MPYAPLSTTPEIRTTPTSTSGSATSAAWRPLPEERPRHDADDEHLEVAEDRREPGADAHRRRGARTSGRPRRRPRPRPRARRLRGAIGPNRRSPTSDARPGTAGRTGSGRPSRSTATRPRSGRRSRRTRCTSRRAAPPAAGRRRDRARARRGRSRPSAGRSAPVDAERRLDAERSVTPVRTERVAEPVDRGRCTRADRPAGRPRTPTSRVGGRGSVDRAGSSDRPAMPSGQRTSSSTQQRRRCRPADPSTGDRSRSRPRRSPVPDGRPPDPTVHDRG